MVAFYSCSARKNRQHGGESGSGLVGQDSIKRGEPWEGKEGVCMAVRTHGKDILAWEEIHRSESQRQGNIYDTSSRGSVSFLLLI